MLLNPKVKRQAISTIFFCDDEYLHKINVEYLQHDTLTDIITFDYTEGKVLHSDIYISVERVKENAEIFKVPFQRELLRVLAHGLLHLCGYKDKTPKDSALMRQKEEEMIVAIWPTLTAYRATLLTATLLAWLQSSLNSHR